MSTAMIFRAQPVQQTYLSLSSWAPWSKMSAMYDELGQQEVRHTAANLNPCCLNLEQQVVEEYLRF